MIKTKLAITIDTLTISLLLSLLLYVWLLRRTKSQIASALIAIAVSSVAFYFLFKHALKKQNLQKLSASDLKKAEIMLGSITYFSKSESDKYFEKLFSAKLISGKIFKGKMSYFYIDAKQKLVSSDFVQGNEFYLAQKETLPLCFVCKEFDEEFSKLLTGSKVNYEVFTASELFLFMKDKNIFPINSSEEKLPRTKKIKKTFSRYFSNLTRSHFKDFLISGLSLITISIFIPYSKYYLVFGSILILLSIASLFNKSKPDQPKSKLTLSAYSKNPNTKS